MRISQANIKNPLTGKQLTDKADSELKPEHLKFQSTCLTRVPSSRFGAIRRGSQKLPGKPSLLRRYRTDFLLNLGTGPTRFSARLRISPGEMPSTKAMRPNVSVDGDASPCSKVVMKDLASPVRTDSSFLDRPRDFLNLASSTGNSRRNPSIHSPASMTGHLGQRSCRIRGSIFRSVTYRISDPVFLTSSPHPAIPMAVCNEKTLSCAEISPNSLIPCSDQECF